MRDGSKPRRVSAGQVLVTSVKRGSGPGHIGSQSRSAARRALRD